MIFVDEVVLLFCSRRAANTSLQLPEEEASQTTSYASVVFMAFSMQLICLYSEGCGSR